MDDNKTNVLDHWIERVVTKHESLEREIGN